MFLKQKKPARNKTYFLFSLLLLKSRYLQESGYKIAKFIEQYSIITRINHSQVLTPHVTSHGDVMTKYTNIPIKNAVF